MSGRLHSPSNIHLTLNHRLQLFSTLPPKISLRTSALLLRLAHAICHPCSFHVERVRITEKIRKLVLLHNRSILIQKESTTKCLRHYFHCRRSQTVHTKPATTKNTRHPSHVKLAQHDLLNRKQFNCFRNTCLPFLTPHDKCQYSRCTCDNDSCTKSALLLQNLNVLCSLTCGFCPPRNCGLP